MHRRRFIAALGVAAGFAGCSSTSPGPGTASETLTPVDPPGSPTETDRPRRSPGDGPAGGGPDTASLIDLKTVPLTYALTPTRYRSGDDGEVRLGFVQTATDEHPARVRGTLTNDSDWTNTFRLRETPPFGRRTAGRDAGDTTDGSDLVFAPTRGHQFATYAPPVERADDGTWRLASEMDREWGPDVHRLAPGESVVGEWHLVGRPGVDGERRAGRYKLHAGDADPSVAIWETDRPGPRGRSQFAGQTVPGLTSEQGGTDWYHRARPETPAYLEPSAERVDLPGAIDLALVNHARAPLSGNSWNLYKLVDGAWHYLEPWGHTAVLRQVPPGGRRTYRLHAFAGEPLPCDGIGVGHLGGGTYAFESMYDVEDGPGHFAALLEIRGPPATVIPSKGAIAERTGARVDVQWPRRPSLPRAALALERLPPDSNVGETVVPEQAMRTRNRGLRNTLAFLEPDVERVALRTDRNTVSAAANADGYEPASRRFVFRDELFEVTASFDEARNSGTPTATETTVETS